MLLVVVVACSEYVGALIQVPLSLVVTIGGGGVQPKAQQNDGCDLLSFLEGQGDLVSGSMTPISHMTTRVISIINLLTKFP